MSIYLLAQVCHQPLTGIGDQVVLPEIEEAAHEEDQYQQQGNLVQQAPVVVHKDAIQEMLYHPGEDQAGPS